MEQVDAANVMVNMLNRRKKKDRVGLVKHGGDKDIKLLEESSQYRSFTNEGVFIPGSLKTVTTYTTTSYSTLPKTQTSASPELKK